MATTTSVMMLVDAGRIRLDDPIGTYIPEFAKQPRMVRTPKPGFAWPVMAPPGSPPQKVEYDIRPARRDITIRDVLTMTSGLQTIGIPNAAIPEIGPTTTVALPLAVRVPVAVAVEVAVAVIVN